MMVAFPSTLSAQSFLFTLACPQLLDSNPQFLKVDVDHRCMPAWASHSTFCSKLIESAKMMACVVQLSPLEAIQHG